MSELDSELAQFGNQLTQIQTAIATLPDGVEKNNLIVLEEDIKELIKLTEFNLSQNQKKQSDPLSEEYKLFQAEVGVCNPPLENDLFSLKVNHKKSKKPKTSNTTNLDDLKTELKSIEGMKCQAPFKYAWAEEVNYHNALVFRVENLDGITDGDEIKVRVMFTNPTHQEMLPCPFYLDGDCKFSDEKCKYSHGEEVDFNSLKDYREPDFGNVSKGKPVFAKKEDGLWHRGVVKSIDGIQCVVKFDSNSEEEVDLQNILPLGNLKLKFITGICDRSKTISSAQVAAVQAVHKPGLVACSIPKTKLLSWWTYYIHLPSANAEPEQIGEDVSDEGDSNKELNHYSNQIQKIGNEEDQMRILMSPPSSTFGEWEKFTKGIGSRMMAKMGYIYGSGLGKEGTGRVEPVPAVILPAGRSLDHCMLLREQSGGDADFFSAEKRLKKLKKKHDKMIKKGYDYEKPDRDVFTFLNKNLGQSTKRSQEPDKPQSLGKESVRNLNITSFELGEKIQKFEKEVKSLKVSLHRYDPQAKESAILKEKLADREAKIKELRALEQKIAAEQKLRSDRKKLTKF